MSAANVIPAQAGIQRPFRVAVVGAPGTGKTRLCQEIAAHLTASEVAIADAPDLQSAQAYDATLLMGLDLPGAAGASEDALLRSQLERAGMAYQVVYGTGPQRLQSALVALVSAGVVPASLVDRPRDEDARRAWNWVCEKCSDPACEHRLFTQLRERRG